MSVETRDLNALQQLLEPPALSGASVTGPRPEDRAQVRIAGVGRYQKGSAPTEAAATVQSWLPTAGVLAGAHGQGIPISFVVDGTADGMSVHLGTWASGTPRANATDRMDVLVAMLRGQYGAIHVEPASVLQSLETSVPGWWVRGIPTAPEPDRLTGALPMDRMIRALDGVRWRAIVIAEPISEPDLMHYRNVVVNQMRIHDPTAIGNGAAPLTRHYLELLAVLLENLTTAVSVGAWRTAVYLIEPEPSGGILASAWRSTYAGDRSVPEPIRLFASPEVARLANEWALIGSSTGPPLPPDAFRHPYDAQSVLTSTQLAAYVHLPQLEAPGFGVLVEPELVFDVQGPMTQDPSIELGRVARPGGSPGAAYAVGTKSLVRHTFVTGMTGSGKTNTIVHLLREAWRGGVPFLVMEPAKTEYRALLADPTIGPALSVFTLGNEQVAPFRMNPFEPESGTSVAVHLDLLRSVFAASFGMWAPLPQVLERCLYEIYEERGWDLTTLRNSRLDDRDEHSSAFPTLSHLADKVDEVTHELGYDEQITGDIRAALLTRIDSMRLGGKGRLLDTRRSVPLAQLLRSPAVLELEDMGDDDDKAFVMGVLLVRLAEHRRANGPSDSLRHLLVIEEAHRLLTAVPQRASEEESDPRGKAVEVFTNLLAEIRAYGEGVIVADQIPGRLAPEVLKNTGLKVVHRVVASDDREVLAGAMAMDDRQARALTTLPVGSAAVFGEGDDAPLLVRIPLSRTTAEPFDHTAVTARAQQLRASTEMESVFNRSKACASVCSGNNQACSRARELLEREDLRAAYARAVLSGVEDAAALGRTWPDVVDVVRAHRDPSDDEKAVLRSVAVHGAEWVADRRGAQSGWTYQQVEELTELLQAAVVAIAEEAPTEAANVAFRDLTRDLQVRSYDPFPACSEICGDGRSPFRWAAADLVASGRFAEPWEQVAAAEDWVSAAWSLAMDAGSEMIEWFRADDPDPNQVAAARRASLCFAQQMLVEGPGRPADLRANMAALLDQT